MDNCERRLVTSKIDFYQSRDVLLSYRVILLVLLPLLLKGIIAEKVQSAGGIVISDWIFRLVSVGVPSEYKLRE